MGDANENYFMSVDRVSNFGRAFISYGSYHYDPINKWIHIICVPIIAATLFSGLSYFPYAIQVQQVRIGAAEIALLLSLAYYLTIKVSLAIGMAIMAAGMAYSWKTAFAGMDEKQMLYWVIGLHVASWALQFIGHGVFQKRKPALMDNITQIFNAPLFVIVEIFEMMNLQSDEMKLWHAQIRLNVEAFRAKNKHQ